MRPSSDGAAWRGAVADFDWKKLDSSQASETVVLLGAGASSDTGRPTSEELHEELVERLAPLYRNLAELVFTSGERPDVERGPSKVRKPASSLTSCG